jgi:hypothetical protein
MFDKIKNVFFIGGCPHPPKANNINNGLDNGWCPHQPLIDV